MNAQSRTLNQLLTTLPPEDYRRISADLTFGDLKARQHLQKRGEPIREQSMACNGLHSVDARCCRWLLHAQDRLSSHELPLTHELLSAAKNREFVFVRDGDSRLCREESAGAMTVQTCGSPRVTAQPLHNSLVHASTIAEEQMAVKQMEPEQARTAEQERQSGRSQEVERQRKPSDQERELARRSSPFLFSPFLSPFALLQRFFTDDVTELLDERGVGGGSRSQPPGVAGLAWAPKIDVIQRSNELVVRADLPGIQPDDVVVEVSDDAITISGERCDEKEEDRGKVYTFERSYGSFLRVIPLPKGAIADQAKATFKDGVLEITVPAPPEQVSRGRRLEISRGDDSNKSSAKDEGTREGAHS